MNHLKEHYTTSYPETFEDFAFLSNQCETQDNGDILRRKMPWKTRVNKWNNS